MEEKKSETKKPRREKQAEKKKSLFSSPAAASSCSSCFPRCFRFGRGKRAEAKDKQKSREAEENFEEEEEEACLQTSDISTLAEGDGEASPLPVSDGTPLFQGLFALGGKRQEREGREKEPEVEALPCLDEEDTLSVEEVERDDHPCGDEENNICEEYLLHVDDDGLVTAGLCVTRGEERTAVIIQYYLDEEATVWFGVDEEEKKEARALRFITRKCLTDGAGQPVVVPASDSSPSVSLCGDGRQSDLAYRLPFISSLGGKRVRLVGPVLLDWRKELQARNERRARRLEEGTDKQTKEDFFINTSSPVERRQLPQEEGASSLAVKLQATSMDKVLLSICEMAAPIVELGARALHDVAEKNGLSAFMPQW